jgi:DNA topoisomerase-3
MTGNWENTLAQIEKDEMQPLTFRQAIEVYTRQITTELLETSISVENENTCACPKCKNGKVSFYPKVAKCSDGDCRLIVFRNKSEKQLTDKQMMELLTTGKTGIIKGFKSKGGKSFDAALKFDEQYNVVFDFPEKKGKKTIGLTFIHKGAAQALIKSLPQYLKGSFRFSLIEIERQEFLLIEPLAETGSTL